MGVLHLLTVLALSASIHGTDWHIRYSCGKLLMRGDMTPVARELIAAFLSADNPLRVVQYTMRKFK